jgi:hypothetical protein
MNIGGTSGTLVPLVPVKQRADWPFCRFWFLGFWYGLMWFYLVNCFTWSGLGFLVAAGLCCLVCPYHSMNLFVTVPATGTALGPVLIFCCLVVFGYLLPLSNSFHAGRWTVVIVPGLITCLSLLGI